MSRSLISKLVSEEFPTPFPRDSPASDAPALRLLGSGRKTSLSLSFSARFNVLFMRGRRLLLHHRTVFPLCGPWLCVRPAPTQRDSASQSDSGFQPGASGTGREGRAALPDSRWMRGRVRRDLMPLEMSKPRGRSIDWPLYPITADRERRPREGTPTFPQLNHTRVFFFSFFFPPGVWCSICTPR